MIDFLRLLACALTGLFRSRARLEAEILVLRHQLNVLRRKAPERVAFNCIDRLVFAGLYRLAPSVLDALKILKPETVVRWHRAGFRTYWRRKSRARGGRPKTPLEIRQLIRDTSIANPLWGAPRIHGELLMFGIDVGQTTVAKYMVRLRRPPSQGWKTFLRNHTDGVASMDLLVIPTISFRLLYGFLILQHRRRVIVWIGVTAHPSAEWIARQLTEAYAWAQAPNTSFAIGIGFMAIFSSGVFVRWASGISRSHRDHHGKMDIRRGSSARSDGSALTMSWCSASSTSASCWDRTKDITMTRARTYR